MILRAFGLACIAASVVAGSALAHHSFAIFDQTKVLNHTGTVKEFELVNPHAWLHVVITDGQGKSATWSFEGGSVAQLVGLGWTREGLRVGDKVQVSYRPMKDGSRGGQIMSVTQADGKKICSNRGCG
jgi:hypothetical protein